MSKKLIIFVALLLCGIPNIVSLPFNFVPFGSELQGRRQGSEFLELSNYAFAQSVDTAWVRRYNGNGPGNSWDGALAIAVDGSGNVYVTGYSCQSSSWPYNEDYATLKYDPAGNQLWVKTYNGPGDSTDYALAIAVDGSGNVYVTGQSWGSGTGYDYATIKYDPAGNQLWVQRYNGPGDSNDVATAIAVDGSGNVYITGSSVGSGTSGDYATIKYNPAGNQLWEKRYNGPGNGGDAASDIAVDGSGNIYVTGYSWGSGTYDDYATIKYDPVGNQLWVQRYNGPGNYHDLASALSVDGSGNVYVTGYSTGSGTGYDYATIKYDPAGNQLWVQRYNGPVNRDDKAYAIALDGSGNVYVTGESGGSGTYTPFDYATIKYNSNGDTAWVRRYDGPGNSWDAALAIAMDGSGNVYVTGSSVGIGTSYDYATVKYYSNGDTAWVRRYNGLGDWGYDYAKAMAVDASGSVYVTGSSSDDYATIKYVQFMRGDANADKQLNVSDVVYLINYLFKGGPVPVPALIVGDANCDGKVTVTDVIYLINYVLKGGPQPCI